MRVNYENAIVRIDMTIKYLDAHACGFSEYETLWYKNAIQYYVDDIVATLLSGGK